MATTENRGGANGGPQYNPTNVNPFGGNGQSGMNTNYTGFGYGQNKLINEQRQAAPITGQASPRMSTSPSSFMSNVTPINAPTQRPQEDISTFSDMNLPVRPVGDPDLDTVISYYPVMRYWANQPDTPEATKDYVRYLGTIIQ